MGNSLWTNKELDALYKLKTEDGLEFSDIAKILQKSNSSVRNKFRRMNWDNFYNNKSDDESDRQNKTWNQSEMIQLFSFLEADQPYEFIAGKLGRSRTSVERKSQDTDWEAWKAAAFSVEEDPSKSEADIAEQLMSQLLNALISVSRHDYARLKQIRKDDFLKRINFEEKELPISFSELKILAVQELDRLGLGNPESISLGAGTYIVVGDSHGKFTKTQMFDLLKQVNKYFKAIKIIHIGHLLDDDNDISYLWGDFKNLIILSKTEELKLVHEQRHKFNFSYEIVRERIQIGNQLIVMNQDLIGDYVRRSLSGLDPIIFEDKMIVNCHRQEVASRAASLDTSNFFISPGALCEKHIIKTIKQIDFQDNRTVKVAYHDGFIKYRRMKALYKYWDQGLLIVHVNDEGDHTVIPCMIQQDGTEYATSYFDKIITSKGVFSPSNKIFVTADMHSPSHDFDVLDIQEQICKDYCADILVNVGDAFDCRSLSHHEIDKGHVILGDFLEETSKTHSVLKRMSEWTKERHIIVGNHERFLKDFVSKFPQLKSILNLSLVCGLEELGYKVTNLKDVLRIGSATFIHGDMSFYNQSGDKLEKTSKTFGQNCFIGHIHYPSIRFKSYSVGLAGRIDQGYNEANASAWIHGFGLCNQYHGKSWATTVAIFNNKCVLNGKTYSPKNPENWDFQASKAKIIYEN